MPQRVSLSRGECTAQPKSQILAMFYLKGGYLMEEDVLGLDVTVQDVIVVHVLHRVADLLDDTPDPVLREAALGL